MGVKISYQGEVMTALLDGDIDHHTAKGIRENIDAQAQKNHPEKLNLDFGKVQFMDSSGIGLIMGRYKLMMSLGGKLMVINVPKNMEKMVKLSGLTALGIME